MSEEEKEAIDILENEIADMVIGFYCTENKCFLRDECTDKECRFNEAIDITIELIDKLQNENSSLKKEIKLMKSVNINENFISKDKIRDKIKELEKTQAYKIGLEEFTIRVLKELLKESE